MTVTTPIDTDPATRTAPVTFPLPAILSAIGRLVDEIRRRQGLVRLADLDDRTLRDIGLTRGEIREAVLGPLTEDAVRTATRLSAARRDRGD